MESNIYINIIYIYNINVLNGIKNLYHDFRLTSNQISPGQFCLVLGILTTNH